jgi:membrane associated rhomboid family serine protease
MSDEERSGRAGPWGPPRSEQAPPDEPPVREPIFNAPWPSVAIVAAILVGYALQSIFAPGDQGVAAWGFAPADLGHGRWQGLLTVMFVHGGWPHALMNALAALAFGPPVARLMGRGLKGPALFFLFYLVCGAISTLAYAAFHLQSSEPVVGASGAIAGLMGGAARLLGPEARPVAPIFSRPVYSLGSSWLIVNALMAVFGNLFIEGARIAWEAHIAGFVAGVLLIGPFAWLAGWRAGRADVT